jgi:hypothetical protein
MLTFADRFPAYMTHETALDCLAESRKRRARHELARSLSGAFDRALLFVPPEYAAEAAASAYRRECLAMQRPYDQAQADRLYWQAYRDALGLDSNQGG